MLVLSRKQNQRIVISGGTAEAFRIAVTICSIQGNTVKLGIEAPSGCDIRREELSARAPTKSRRKDDTRPRKDERP